MDSRNGKAEQKLAHAVIDAALKHVVFDGWSDQTLKKVCLELKLSEHKAYQIFKRGGVDLALAFHKRDDEQFQAQFALSEFNKPDQRIRDRIQSAINSRLDIASKNKEAVKRSMSLLTSPLYLPDGTKALWSTSDIIWTAIGDESDDLNWYSKRLILSSVYSAVMIFWVEDESENFSATKDFVKRRISDVMEIERFKSTFKKSLIWTDFLSKFQMSYADMKKFKESFPGW